jgi:hypothetical protein
MNGVPLYEVSYTRGVPQNYGSSYDGGDFQIDPTLDPALIGSGGDVGTLSAGDILLQEMVSTCYGCTLLRT